MAALRTLAARTRTPAAALLGSQAPHVSPPAGAAPSRFFVGSFQGRPTYGTKDVKMLYKENLEILNGVKEQEREMNKHFRILKVGSKCLKWSYRLLFPLPLAATVLKVTH